MRIKTVWVLIITTNYEKENLHTASMTYQSIIICIVTVCSEIFNKDRLVTQLGVSFKHKRIISLNIKNTNI